MVFDYSLITVISSAIFGLRISSFLIQMFKPMHAMALNKMASNTKKRIFGFFGLLNKVSNGFKSRLNSLNQKLMLAKVLFKSLFGISCDDLVVLRIFSCFFPLFPFFPHENQLQLSGIFYLFNFQFFSPLFTFALVKISLGTDDLTKGNENL